MRFMFIQVTQFSVHYFKSLRRVKLPQEEKARFIKGNELNFTQIIIFYFFLRVYCAAIIGGFFFNVSSIFWQISQN